MGEKKKASLSLKTIKVLRKANVQKLLLIGAVISLVFVLSSLLFDRYSKIIRDNARKDLMREIKTAAGQIYEKNGKYPSAVLFSQDRALICEDIDCLQSRSVDIGKYAKSISGINNETSRTQTKYDYELAEDGYKLGYCDENGTIQNFGISRESIILMCN